ncbi:hypothetical protein ACVBKF_01830 [Shewanella sp. 0m-11]
MKKALIKGQSSIKVQPAPIHYWRNKSCHPDETGKQWLAVMTKESLTQKSTVPQADLC